MQGIQAKSNQTCFRFEQLKLLLYLISHYEQVFILNKPQGKSNRKAHLSLSALKGDSISDY